MIMDIVGALLVVSGVAFFTAGTVGLIRFPDVNSRLHALTKADNLGLGLLLAGVAMLWGSWPIAGLLLLTWVLALLAASVSAHLLASLNNPALTSARTAERARHSSRDHSSQDHSAQGRGDSGHGTDR
ncbi:MAG TPA: monovalent cation/H(+) antiporter subunit G [Candidatus Nesterenkonia stercoripullorum]|uniref:Monovalent cation/H(+) antiporter subunit G n=1 Tax=Candidatus Nesterenkonia stercoripullorum TaxID=2838701 RepID=A0A9D1UTZ2_9MICC|nr:monovalent cation/H(+) antiporter subunit G [Candidatus Nesterenkonia stercoripullorum]